VSPPSVTKAHEPVSNPTTQVWSFVAPSHHTMISATLVSRSRIPDDDVTTNWSSIQQVLSSHSVSAHPEKERKNMTLSPWRNNRRCWWSSDLVIIVIHHNDLINLHICDAILRAPCSNPSCKRWLASTEPPRERATKFDPYHLKPLLILTRSLRPEVEILFRLEMCGVACVLQTRPKRFFLHQRLPTLKLLL
jgi:hypothetical protein